eukprot:jgi/Psemu1/19781/gm1.19781_g
MQDFLVNTWAQKVGSFESPMQYPTGGREIVLGRGYYKLRILPELDLMEGCGGVGGALKAYQKRPVENQPRANPLDTSLFSQLNCAVDQHVILSKDFTDKDKKFSLATPG